MTIVTKAENMVARLLKSAPHLPKNAQKWIVDNSWWIVLIDVIVSAISVLIAINAIAAYMTFVGNVGSYSGLYAISPYPSGWIIGSIITLVFSVVTIIILATSITFIKETKKKGWDRLFIVLLIEAVSIVLGAILTLSILGFILNIIFGAIGLAIGTYFVFEIRSYFVSGSTKATTKLHSAKK
jgi:hypothetical protein